MELSVTPGQGPHLDPGGDWVNTEALVDLGPESVRVSDAGHRRVMFSIYMLACGGDRSDVQQLPIAAAVAVLIRRATFGSSGWRGGPCRSLGAGRGREAQPAQLGQALQLGVE